MNAQNPLSSPSAPLSQMLVPEGVYQAKLIEVREFTNAFSPRIGLVFVIIHGDYKGRELMESATAGKSHRGKLAELLRGFGQRDESPSNLVGCQCQVVIKHKANQIGTKYAAVVHTIT